MRYNANNAWIFNGNNGNLNNNNVNNSNRCQGVTNLLRCFIHATTMNKKRFAELMDMYFVTRKNKRYGRDAMAYEMSWVSNLVYDAARRENRTFRIDHNYTFLVSSPKWREIFATEFAGRLADHEVCDALMPYVERELSPRTYNNRKGMGSQAAINRLIEDIFEVSNDYTEDTWIIKVDLKGYFPSAMWNVAERQIDDIIDKYIIGSDRQAYMRWLVMVLIHANPAAHCERRTPHYLWREHIEPSKSLFSKPEGEGAAIGRMMWQTAMGLYISEDIFWLTEECGVRTVCFVDDIVMVVPERRKAYALSLIPRLRERLLTKNIRMNERKFYCQPYGHGVEFLGSHIKPYRIHVNNRTYKQAIERIEELNEARYKNVDKLVSSFNSYGGLLKNRTDYGRLQHLRSMIDEEWWQQVEWNQRKQCLSYRKGYGINERYNRKYHLKLRNHDKSRKKECALHGAHGAGGAAVVQ